MKRIFISILMTILCGTGITIAADREYVPMLVEGRKWVNAAYLGAINKHYGYYFIEVKGDTIVEDRTYKKVYRYSDEHNASSLEFFEYGALYTSKYHPAACLREEDGVVYKLCDKNRSSDENYWEHDYYLDYDIWGYDWCYPYKYYPKVVNSTDDHYEVVIYDFNNPNGIYAGIGELNRNSLLQCKDMIIDGIARRVYSVNGEIDYNWMIVEGLGAISNYYGDMICPNWRRWTSDKYDNIIWAAFILENERMIYNNSVFEESTNTIIGDWYSYYCDEFHINRYDLTGDGLTDVEDVNFMINNILDITPQDMKADLNMDRVIDVADLNAIINIILKID